ncbi:type IV secretion system DNA-binding domain-containing protein [Brevundimonas sp. 2R-24]|uniref:Type IV secretion system DNA-binding domain-containing protein n=1 Tax=Peiella sedimenti TaxID=3061083 RepID=A0ABT8SNG8_9CAUL|nr:type IV secretion system DNA-binding domain-containing protein [Caulobacteraceae bacterium XZ-24]
MSSDPNAVSYLGETTFRRAYTRFGIRQADRLLHVHIIGKTGVGKSRLLESLVRQDIEAGRGFALVDPHGDLAARVWESASNAERDRITYLNGPDPRQPYGYNPLRRVRDDRIPLAASGLLETLRKLWPNAWGVRMEHVLRNSLYALLERDDVDLTDILGLYNDKKFRVRVARDIRNDVVREFWKVEFENYPARLRAEAIAPIQNKLGALLSDPTLHRIFVAPASDIRFRPLMDEGRGLLVNLSRGELGEDASQILGGFIVSTIAMAAFSRANMPEPERRPFFLYVDEFQSFTTLAFVNMMAELRKYGVGLTLAHQHLHQLEPDIRHAVLGNAGTLIAFRVGAEDAPFIGAEFQPTFGAQDVMSLPNRHAYLRLMIDQAPSKPFSARTLVLLVGV